MRAISADRVASSKDGVVGYIAITVVVQVVIFKSGCTSRIGIDDFEVQSEKLVKSFWIGKYIIQMIYLTITLCVSLLPVSLM